MRAVQTGDRIGEYFLLEKLGEGGFGVVWKAENPDLPGKVVAIKVPKSDAALRMLRVESTTQHRLEHHGIVRTLSVNLTHDPPYAVMEFVPGRSLRQILSSNGPVPVTRMVAIARDVLDAIAFAHSRNVVHGDISPSNVLLDDRGRARLADFGLSKDGAPGQDSLSLSGMGSGGEIVRVHGTLAYMAPELRVGDRKTKESDVFALGVLLLELATGDPSYMRFPIEQMPAWLSGIVETATMRDKTHRFRDAERMLETFLAASRKPAEVSTPTGDHDPAANLNPFRAIQPRSSAGRVKFHCSKCGNKMQAAAEARGRHGVCPSCGAQTQVPIGNDMGRAKPLTPVELTDDPEALIPPAGKIDRVELVDAKAEGPRRVSPQVTPPAKIIDQNAALGPNEVKALVAARRMHHYVFAHQALPRLFFTNPARLVAAFLNGDDAAKLLADVWDSVGDAVVADGLGPKLSLNGLKATLEWIGSKPCALIELPSPAGVTEAYFVAAVLNGVFDDGPAGRIHTMAGLAGLSTGLTAVHPDSARLPADAPNGFYFTLERGVTESGEWRTVLCSWDKANHRSNFGDGPSPEGGAFLRVIRSLLEQETSPPETSRGFDDPDAQALAGAASEYRNARISRAPALILLLVAAVAAGGFLTWRSRMSQTQTKGLESASGTTSGVALDYEASEPRDSSDLSSEFNEIEKSLNLPDLPQMPLASATDDPEVKRLIGHVHLGLRLRSWLEWKALMDLSPDDLTARVNEVLRTFVPRDNVLPDITPHINDLARTTDSVREILSEGHRLREEACRSRTRERAKRCGFKKYIIVRWGISKAVVPTKPNVVENASGLADVPIWIEIANVGYDTVECTRASVRLYTSTAFADIAPPDLARPNFEPQTLRSRGDLKGGLMFSIPSGWYEPGLILAFEGRVTDSGHEVSQVNVLYEPATYSDLEIAYLIR